MGCAPPNPLKIPKFTFFWLLNFEKDSKNEKSLKRSDRLIKSGGLGGEAPRNFGFFGGEGLKFLKNVSVASRGVSNF